MAPISLSRIMGFFTVGTKVKNVYIGGVEERHCPCVSYVLVPEYRLLCVNVNFPLRSSLNQSRYRN